MKRTDMLLRLQEILVEAPDDIEQAAQSILTRLEKAGMAPPCLDSDRVQCLLQIYFDPNFNMWNEEFEADPKLVSAYERRMAI